MKERSLARKKERPHSQPAKGDSERGQVQMEAHTVTQIKLGSSIQGYDIKAILGVGGFGITYLAFDRNLGKSFALKEYFPGDFAQRNKGGTVRAKAAFTDDFSWGKNRFLEEARVLARFQHPNIVGVSRIFEANGTAYIVQEYQSGRSLKQWLSELEGPPNQLELDLVIKPLLDALELIHSNGILHRDIAPDNIYIRDDGTPVLLDFGSAREAVAQKAHTVSAIVKGGFSPPEQYSTRGKGQGPWSDIYALASTLYVAVTGETPPEATDRILNDDLKSIRELSKIDYRPGFLNAIEWGMRVTPSERPQSVSLWRAAMLEDSSIPSAILPNVVEALSTSENTAYQSSEAQKKSLFTIVIAAVVLIVGGFGFWTYLEGQKNTSRQQIATERESLQKQSRDWLREQAEKLQRQQADQDAIRRRGDEQRLEHERQKLAQERAMAQLEEGKRREAGQQAQQIANSIKAMQPAELCRAALNPANDAWEHNSSYALHVAEAQSRSLTVSACRTTLTPTQPALKQVCNTKFHTTNIRNAPGAQGTTIIGRLSNGDALSVIGEGNSPTSGHKWLQVRFEGNQTGYIDHELVADNCQSTINALPRGEICNVKYSVTNMRTGPSAKRFQIAKQLSNGDQVHLLGDALSPDSGHKWLQIRMVSSGEVGFVDHELVASTGCSSLVAAAREEASASQWESNAPSTLTFTVRNTTRLIIHFKLFSNNRKGYTWPSTDRAWISNPINQNTNTIACKIGENICLGAFVPETSIS